jgi:hypothetical protein
VALGFDIHSRFLLSYNAPGIRTTVVCPGHILTPFLSTVKLPQNRFYQFFFPSAQPIDVVKPIIAALDAQQSQTIMVPFYTHLAPYLKMLPSFMLDLAQYVSCVLGFFTLFHVNMLSHRSQRGLMRCQTLRKSVVDEKTRDLSRYRSSGVKSSIERLV